MKNFKQEDKEDEEFQEEDREFQEENIEDEEGISRRR